MGSLILLFVVALRKRRSRFSRGNNQVKGPSLRNVQQKELYEEGSRKHSGSSPQVQALFDLDIPQVEPRGIRTS